MSCTGYVIQINAERLEKPTAIPACLQKILSYFSPVSKFQRFSGICLKWPKGRTIRKVMGGGEGNFRAAGIFFRYQIPSMNFF